MLKRPQKAPTESITDDQLIQLFTLYPYLVASPKLDGFRAMKDEIVKTSSMKPFTNRYVQSELADVLDGLDGEIMIGDPTKGSETFHDISGALRRFDGEPDFRFYVFDQFIDKQHCYEDRWLNIVDQIPEHPRVVILEWKILKSFEELLEYECECIEAGYEGIMPRSPYGKYKEGRCTLLEGNIFKRKPVVEEEAIVLGFIEEMENQNEAKTDERGLTKRSKHKENLVPKGTMGALICVSPTWKEPFHVHGGTEAYCQEVWDNRDKKLHMIVKYKYQKYGSKDRPRLPILLCERPEWDIDPEKLQALKKLV